MILARVIGTVVSSTTSTDMDGARYLLLDRSDQYGKTKGDYLVAIDLVGANRDELVMVSETSAARDTLATTNKAVDAIIVGIVDLIDENEKITYKK
jgi:microcompartment protein CcmK/EutM